MRLKYYFNPIKSYIYTHIDNRDIKKRVDKYIMCRLYCRRWRKARKFDGDKFRRFDRSLIRNNLMFQSASPRPHKYSRYTDDTTTEV